MQLKFEHQGNQYHCDTADAASIAIELQFDGAQPNHFGVPKASSAVVKQGGFVGDTKAGGSCNVRSLNFVPHCNGTHTETVGHIVDQDIPVGEAAINPLIVAMLVTVKPKNANQINESYRPELEGSDQLIDSTWLLEAISKVGDADTIRPEALIVRTLPNEVDKRSRVYSEKTAPPFFTVEAIEAINSLGIQHLLTDIPSIDRMSDDGLLTNHHLFWSVPEGTHALTESTERTKTITEMIFVADEIADGLFGLSIQVPALNSDAAPSRPIIMPLKPA